MSSSGLAETPSTISLMSESGWSLSIAYVFNTDAIDGSLDSYMCLKTTTTCSSSRWPPFLDDGSSVSTGSC